MIEKNVHLLPPLKLSPWRKISLGSWRPNGDSQVYFELRVNSEHVTKKLKELNATSEEKITLVHLVGKIMGRVLREVPDLNSVVRLGNVYPRRDVDVFFQVVYNRTELSGHVIRQIDTKSMEQVARELNENGIKIKTGQDLNFNKIKKSWQSIPGIISRLVLDAIGFISYSLNINIAGSGVPRDCFGSMMITSIGSLGFQSAFVPLAPYTRIPLVLALGKPELRPVCSRDGSIIAQEQVSLCFTFDHRIMDGAQGARMAKLIERYFEKPELIDT